MFCPKCGTNVENGTKFCVSCGTDVTVTQQPVVQQTAPSYAQPQQYTQNTYAPQPPRPQYNTYQPPDLNAPMRVGEYIVSFILIAIPIVNLIMLLVWTFGSTTNINKKNFAKAVLILTLIGIGLWIIIAIITAALGYSILSSGRYYY